MSFFKVKNNNIRTTESCTVGGNVGAAVQVTLGVLVIIVLSAEYLAEYIYHKCCSPPSQLRSFRTALFDGYKISSGALISHLFNIFIAIFVTEVVSKYISANECAIYAISFFYETSGLAFVQLLQYCFIEYAHKMSYPSSNANEISRARMTLISNPGIYNDKIQFTYLRVILAILVTMLFAFVVIQFYNWSTTIGISLLFSLGICITVIAPYSLLWQTLSWISIKVIEKSIWTVFAIAQTMEFARWSKLMNTGNPVLNAWLFLAILPILINTFMFLMFSRMSRLQFPCVKKIKSRERLDAIHFAIENIKSNSNSIRSAKNILIVDKRDNIDLSELREYSSVSHAENENILNVKDDELDEKIEFEMSDDDRRIEISNILINANDIENTFSDAEAFKVGVLYMMVLNITLLTIAWTYFFIEGAGYDLLILLVTMLIGPLIIAMITIYIFQYIINGRVRILL